MNPQEALSYLADKARRGAIGDALMDGTSSQDAIDEVEMARNAVREALDMDEKVEEEL